MMRAIVMLLLLALPSAAFAEVPPGQGVIRASMKPAIESYLARLSRAQLRARTQGDSIWDGIAKGAVVGVVAAVFLTGGGDRCTGMSCGGCIVVTTGMWAALGGAIDLMHARAGLAVPPPEGGPQGPPLRSVNMRRR